VVAPTSSFNQAVLSDTTLNLNNQNIVIDSYDSRDPAKSTNGLYDESKRQENGNIATNGNLLQAGNAYVYGDVSTNSGTSTGVENVTGTIRNDFYQALIPIGEPNWSAINPSPSTVNGTATINASSVQGSASSRYRLDRINLNGSQKLTIAGNPDGSTTYIEIYVTGSISESGNAQIILGDGVKATIYFHNDVDITGQGILNPANQPGDLLMYGVQLTDGSSHHVKLGGNGQIS